MPKTKKSKTKSGSALLLTTILLFVILGMVVSLTYVTVMEQKMSSKTKSSIGSFYSAESGIEWALNKIANTTESTISGAFGSGRFNSDGSVKCPDSFGADICKVYLLDQNGKVITNLSLEPSDIKAVRSVGTQGNETTRAIEAAVAADSVPSGTVWFFNLVACPSGWSELTAARGKYLVGLPAGGTLAGTQGTALSNLENRPAGAHTHNLSPYYTPYGSTTPSGGGAWDMDKTTSTKATDDGGLVPGTNAPYIQLLVCQKD